MRRTLQAILSAKHYRVFQAASGAEGLSLAVEENPALIILDLEMPGMHGLEVCKTLRAWYHDPIIILSVIEREDDKISAFRLGADDYVTKPFKVGELIARLEAHLRRRTTFNTPSIPQVIETGALRIALAQRRVTVNGVEVKLTPVEFELLALLARHPNCVVTTAQILRAVWGEEDVDTNIIRVHLLHLRRKLGITNDGPQYLQTEPGVGIRFVCK